MSKQLVFLVLGLIAFGFAITSNANTYIVGDNSGWDISTNLDTWQRGKKFVEGDVLGNFLSQFRVLSLFMNRCSNGLFLSLQCFSMRLQTVCVRWAKRVIKHATQQML